MGYEIAENPDVLLDFMQQHEQAIAALYQAYAERFEAYADFWTDLSRAELKHAACLALLQSRLKDNPDIVIVRRFSIDAIKSSIRYVTELIHRVTQPEFSPINAFSLAMKLEEALLEKDFFEIFTGDSQETKDTLLLLLHETQEHFEVIKDALNEYKAGNA